MKYRRYVISIAFLLTASVCLAQIELKPEGYFEKQGFAFLVYHNYYAFDFTDIKLPGHYYLIYGDQKVGSLTISRDVYKETWHPTMDVFFPVQMCHVEVRQGEKGWISALDII